METYVDVERHQLPINHFCLSDQKLPQIVTDLASWPLTGLKIEGAEIDVISYMATLEQDCKLAIYFRTSFISPSSTHQVAVSTSLENIFYR